MALTFSLWQQLYIALTFWFMKLKQGNNPCYLKLTFDTWQEPLVLGVSRFIESIALFFQAWLICPLQFFPPFPPFSHFLSTLLKPSPNTLAPRNPWTPTTLHYPIKYHTIWQGISSSISLIDKKLHYCK